MFLAAIIHWAPKTAGETPEVSCEAQAADPNFTQRGQVGILAACKAADAGIKRHLIMEIIKRESGYDPSVCNKGAGCGSGQGLMQIIPNTLKSCERALGRELDPFKPGDNLDCGVWLIQTRGIQPWEAYSGPY